jgi:hypothetical protein
MKVKIVGDYEIHHTLGEGSFGKVKYAIKRSSGEALAIKVSIWFDMPLIGIDPIF